jgi:hypothetical protein
VAVLLAIAFGLREIYESSDSAMVQAVMSTCRNMIHISLLFMWVVSLHRRLMNKNVRRLMLCVGGLLIFWHIFYTCPRFYFAFDHSVYIYIAVWK